jgi:hypothetical protein
MAPEKGDAPTQESDILVMRFFGIGGFAFDFNIYGIGIGRYATLTFGLTDFQIQRTNRHGRPTEGSAAFPTFWAWRLTEIRSARVFKSPRWIRMAMIDASRYPFGLLLDMGASGWNVLLFSMHLEDLIQAFTSHDVHVDSHPRTLTPLVFRREK